MTTKTNKKAKTPKTSPKIKTCKSIYMIAGEESGDQIGGSLMEALNKKATDFDLSFEGIGGNHMSSQGLRSLFPMTELSIMGLLEIIPHIVNVLARLNQTVEDIKRLRPDLVVTIDAPGFNFRLAKRLKSLNIPVVHITAPTVWAWRPRRAERVAGYLTHLLTLFHFEPPYFTKHGLKTTFMGHPLVEKKLWDVSPELYRKNHQIKKKQPLLCLLPGSRAGEIKNHLPIFLDTVEMLKANHPDLEVVVPTLPRFKDQIETALKQRGIAVHITTDEEEKYQAMRASTAALAASGTVTLELGLCDTPMVVAYKGNPISAAIVKRMLLTKHVSLTNILLEKQVVPELLQENCKAQDLSLELNRLLKDKSNSHAIQKKELFKLQKLVQSDSGKTPSEMAAAIILETLKK